MSKRKRLFSILGGAAFVLAVGGGLLASGVGVSRSTTQIYMADGPSFDSLAALSAKSHAVAHVKVVDVSESYTVAFDKAQAVTAPLPAGGPKEKAGAKPPEAEAGEVLPVGPGLVKTDVTVEVVDAFKGSGLKKGDRVVIAQLGGTNDQGDLIEVEDDPLMKKNGQEVVFLQRDAASGKFFTAGGAQGRFAVEQDKVKAVDAHSPLAKAHNGKSLGAFRGAVQSER